MDPQTTPIHQKLISFPDPIYSRLIKRSKKIGFSFSEYIRLMSVQHLQTPEPFEEVEKLDVETSKSVAEGEMDIKNGNYVTLHNRKEIEDYFNNL